MADDSYDRAGTVEAEPGDWSCLIPSGRRFNTQALLDPSPYRDNGPLYIDLYQCRYCGQEFARSDAATILPRHLVAPHLDGRCADNHPTEGDGVNIILDLKAMAARLALALPRSAEDVLADLRQAQGLLTSGRIGLYFRNFIGRVYHSDGRESRVTSAPASSTAAPRDAQCPTLRAM